jgi:hypothetical protein
MIPHASDEAVAVTGGSTATTIDRSSGHTLTRCASIQSRRHRLPDVSSTISPKSSCRPSAVPA